MAHSKARRSALFVAAVSGALLCLASVAFACSRNFNGEMKVWGGAGGTATAIGEKQPNTGTMNYCPGYPSSPVSFNLSSTETLTISMASATDACSSGAAFPNKLGLNPAYAINIIETDAFTAVWTLDASHGDCMTGRSGIVASPVPMSVNNSGNGLATITYTANGFKNGAGKAAGICVSDTGPTNAMEAPIVFI